MKATDATLWKITLLACCVFGCIYVRAERTTTQPAIETGPGGRSCGQFVNAEKKMKQLPKELGEVLTTLAWIDGYIVGAAKMSPQPFDSSAARQQAHQWVVKYCTLRPNALMSEATLGFVTEAIATVPKR